MRGKVRANEPLGFGLFGYASEEERAKLIALLGFLQKYSSEHPSIRTESIIKFSVYLCFPEKIARWSVAPQQQHQVRHWDVEQCAIPKFLVPADGE